MRFRVIQKGIFIIKVVKKASRMNRPFSLKKAQNLDFVMVAMVVVVINAVSAVIIVVFVDVLSVVVVMKADFLNAIMQSW